MAKVGGARIGAGRKPAARARASFTAGLPPAPRWLAPDARQVYRHVGRQLEAAHVVTTADREVLACYAATVAEIGALAQALQAPGFSRVLETPAGLRTHPLVTQYQQAISRSRQLAQDLGLTPASRGRVQVTAPAETDALQAQRAAFFSRPSLVAHG